MTLTEYDFILTRDELIDEAYRKIGVLAEGQNISADQLSTANAKLNSIIKAWEGTGGYLWSYLTEAVSTSASTSYVTLPTANGIHYIDRAYIVINSSSLPLERFSVSQYASIARPSQSGQPILFSQNTAEQRIYFWPVPDAVYSINLWGYRRLKDWESASSTGEFPSRWQVALKYTLAVELGEDYRLPIKELQYLRTIANTEYNKARLREVDVADENFVQGAY